MYVFVFVVNSFFKEFVSAISRASSSNSLARWPPDLIAVVNNFIDLSSISLLICSLILSNVLEKDSVPKALAVAWDLLKSDAQESSKIVTLLKFDEVLGFKLENHVGYEIPQKVQDLAKMRNEYRKAGIWDKADQVRKEVESLGFVIEDKPNGQFKIKRKL